jgi:hypothetical protein
MNRFKRETWMRVNDLEIKERKRGVEREDK